MSEGRTCRLGLVLEFLLKTPVWVLTWGVRGGASQVVIVCHVSSSAWKRLWFVEEDGSLFQSLIFRIFGSSLWFDCLSIEHVSCSINIWSIRDSHPIWDFSPSICWWSVFVMHLNLNLNYLITSQKHPMETSHKLLKKTTKTFQSYNNRRLNYK